MVIVKRVILGVKYVMVFLAHGSVKFIPKHTLHFFKVFMNIIFQTYLSFKMAHFLGTHCIVNPSFIVELTKLVLLHLTDPIDTTLHLKVMYPYDIVRINGSQCYCRLKLLTRPIILLITLHDHTSQKYEYAKKPESESGMYLLWIY